MSILRGLFGRTTRSRSFDFQNRLSFLEVDMHNHILPNIDDGAENLEQSYQLIKGLKTLGIQQFICTPHIDNYKNLNVIMDIDKAYHQLKDYVAEKGEEIALTYAAEYLVNKPFHDYLKTGMLKPLPGGYVLIEQPYHRESKHLFDVIERIQQLGYKPVLAHPERHTYYHDNPKIFEKIKDKGCLLQLNLLSGSSYYGSTIKKTATHLMKRGMYDFVGTDVHHERHILALQEVLSKYDMPSLLNKCTIRNASLKDYFANHA